MKQTYLVHYYIVGYIKGKEENYLISLADLIFHTQVSGIYTSEFNLEW